MIGLDFQWDVEQLRGGQVIHEESGPNLVVQEGQELILTNFFRYEALVQVLLAEQRATPGTPVDSPTFDFHARLTTAALSATSTLASAAGNYGGGGGDPGAAYYAAVAVERSAVGFPTIELDLGNYRAVSKVLNFTALQAFDVSSIFLATAATGSSGTLICRYALNPARSLEAGDTMQARIRVKVGPCAS